MIRETIGEPHNVPEEGYKGEMNPEVSSIQHTGPDNRYDDEKSENS
jgi:hypothetical protein